LVCYGHSFSQVEDAVSQHIQIERLADELKSLVGWRALPERLVMKPTLCQMAGVREDMSLTVAGGLAYSHLEDSINSLTGVYEFEGRKIDAQKLNRAFKLLLGFEGPKEAPARRRRVILLIEAGGDIPVMPDQWRRPFGPERYFLKILAKEMVLSAATVVA
jgi:hypothetical protein